MSAEQLEEDMTDAGKFQRRVKMQFDTMNTQSLSDGNVTVKVTAPAETVIPGGFATTSTITEKSLSLQPIANAVTRSERKGGTFAPADIPLIKRALHVYLIDCQRANDNHPDVTLVANLLHRLGRIS